MIHDRISYKSIIIRFIELFTGLVLCFALFRVFQVCCLSNGRIALLFKANIIGIANDSLLCLLSAIITFPVFLALARRKTLKVAEIFFIIFYCVILVLEILLAYFFHESNVPLGAVLFYYSIPEIVSIIQTAHQTPWYFYVVLVAIPTIFIWYSTRKNIRKLFFILITSIIFVSAWLVKFVTNSNKLLNIEYYTSLNKLSFFIVDSITDCIESQQSESNISETTTTLHNYFSQLQFENNTPLYHKTPTKNILSNYIQKSVVSPHIVIIIVEGLARENSGPYSRYTSATPFLDSLAANGLYWENCFSSAPRTMCVLPSVLGPLPFGNGGFLSYQTNKLHYNSLPRILTANNYSFNFFYGGWLGFDNMESFLKDNNLSQHISAEKIKESLQNSPWGMNDSVMFSEATKLIDYDKKRLDVYLTLTSHEPISYPNQKNYEVTYKTFERQNPKIENSAVYLYVDHCIRQLVNEYKNHEGFENTIFIITGDHNCLSTSINTDDITTEESILYRYHVPLIIWSPLIHSPAIFSSIVSHRDITPSLLSFLQQTYSLEIPEYVAWLNSGLDTCDIALSNSFAPQFNTTSRHITNLIYKNYFYLNNSTFEIYSLNHQLHLRGANNKNDYIERLFQSYKSVDRYSMTNNQIVLE